MDDALIAAAAEGDFQTFFCKDKRPVNEHVDGAEQLLLCIGAVYQLLKGVARVGCHLITLFLQQFCQLCKSLCLGKWLTAREGDTAAQGIGTYNFLDTFFLHGGTAAECPCFGVVAALTMVGTALCEDGHANAGAVYDAVVYNSR